MKGKTIGEAFQDLDTAQDEIPQAARWHGWRSGQGYHSSSSSVGGAAWVPAVDISELGAAYLVTVEIPGVGAEEMEITLEDGLLTIQGERHAVRGATGEKVHRSERGYGVFRRSVTLPSSHVQADKTEAETRDGVLRILVPKAPGVQAKSIQVRVGQGDVADVSRM
jgi:HSP20 family protein